MESSGRNFVVHISTAPPNAIYCYSNARRRKIVENIILFSHFVQFSFVSFPVMFFSLIFLSWKIWDTRRVVFWWKRVEGFQMKIDKKRIILRHGWRYLTAWGKYTLRRNENVITKLSNFSLYTSKHHCGYFFSQFRAKKSPWILK